jgi:hypothetical protein
MQCLRLEIQNQQQVCRQSNAEEDQEMIQELIEIAEEIYTKDQAMGVRLGLLIEQIGKELQYMDNKCKEFYDAKIRLESRVKQLELDLMTIRKLQ